MNKKTLFSILAVFIVLAFSSCITTQSTSSRVCTYKTVDIQTAPVIADIEIDQTRKSAKVAGTTNDKLEKLKSVAISEVLEKNNGDVLIEPTYVVETNNSSVSVTVSGFVGKYTNIRQTKAKDGVANVITFHPGTVGVNSNQPQQAEKKGALGLGVLGL